MPADTPEYRSWLYMMKNQEKYRYDVCKRWHTFENFLADMGSKPENHSLNRIYLTEPHGPGNSRWLDYSRDSGNRTNQPKWRERKKDREEMRFILGLIGPHSDH